MSKKRDDNCSIRIPEELAKEVDSLIGKHGFRSRAEITKNAIREFLEKYPETKEIPA